MYTWILFPRLFIGRPVTAVYNIRNSIKTAIVCNFRHFIWKPLGCKKWIFSVLEWNHIESVDVHVKKTIFYFWFSIFMLAFDIGTSEFWWEHFSKFSETQYPLQFMLCIIICHRAMTWLVTSSSAVPYNWIANVNINVLRST